MKTIRLLHIIFVTIVAATTSLAATDFRFRHYTVNDGLPSATVGAIVQDKMGFMWFGSDNGLFRYDGVSISRYCYNHDVNEQYVSCLYDEGNHLWIDTYTGGINRMDTVYTNPQTSRISTG